MKIKNSFLLVSILLLNIIAYSQVSFEEGYFIDNNDKRINCLIENIDWKNNPKEFTYKLTEDSNPRKETIRNVKEFGINDFSRYVRHKVMIDRSPDDPVRKLSESGQPNLKEEELFLNVLVEGEASLYMYVDQRLKRYFYNKDGSAVEPLIFKRFIRADNKVGTNSQYKQQLYNELKCPNFSIGRIDKLEYRKNQLIRFFVEYNECNGHEVENYDAKREKHIFNFSIRPGLSIGFLTIESEYNLRDFKFDAKLGYRVGVEFEYILPYNKNKWAVILEPTYQVMKGETTNFEPNIPGNYLTGKIDYSSIELPAGIRHYFHLNEKSKLFLNASFVVDITFKSSVELLTVDNFSYYDIQIETRPNAAFGMGYKFDNKFSVEMRYQTNRELFSRYVYWRGKYNTLSFNLAYTFLNWN